MSRITDGRGASDLLDGRAPRRLGVQVLYQLTGVELREQRAIRRREVGHLDRRLARLPQEIHQERDARPSQ
jgi:hypothetical protein